MHAVEQRPGREEPHDVMSTRAESHPDPISQNPVDATEEVDEPTCRICFDTTNSPANPLFRPCACKGTMGFVHVDCLERWRQTSSNRKSFHRCDNCHYEYKFQTVVGDRLRVAKWIGTPGILHLVSVVALLLLVFLCGVAWKFGISADDYASAFREIWTYSTMLEGSLCVGLGSCMCGLLSFMGHMPFLGRTFNFGNFNFNTSGEVGKIVTAIGTIIGLVLALRWLYLLIKDYTDFWATHGQRVVLDARTGQPPAEKVD